MVRPLVTLAIAVVVAGCGEEAERPTAASEATPTATATVASPPATATVTIEGFTYDPARVTVRRGAEVTWDNKDASNHTVTFSAKKGPDDIGNLRAGRKGTVTFQGRGSYAYVCEFHPGMAGTVEVR